MTGISVAREDSSNAIQKTFFFRRSDKMPIPTDDRLAYICSPQKNTLPQKMPVSDGMPLLTVNSPFE